MPKLSLRKLEALPVLWNFFLPRLCLLPALSSNNHAWNCFACAWSPCGCWISCRNWLEAVGPTLFISLEPLFNYLKVPLNVCFIGTTLEDNYWNCLNFVTLPYVHGRALLVILLGYVALLDISWFLDYLCQCSKFIIMI